DQLRAILAHELAHIRRHDYLANILQTVVEILGFYHPAVWWVSSRIRIERENCCDDLAVQVCGNTLQYARALTSMEEMRHSRSDLALAASGGSLMARIARLLGRPAVDDRRFAWLPGLVALLLVAGVVIPTALALARSAPSAPESPAEEAPAPPAPVELPDAQIAVGFVLADVASDGVLAPQTAAEAASLLERITNPAVPPTVEELRRPLGEVLSAFTPAPGRANDFIDLLGRDGYPMRKLWSPRVTVASGKPMSFAMGTPPDSDASTSKDPDFVSMQFEAVAMALQDRKEVRIDVNLARAYPVDDRATPRIKTAMWTLKTTILTPDDQWTLIQDNQLKFTQNGREYIQLPVIRTSVVDEPAIDTAAVLPATPMGQTVDVAPGMGGMGLPASADAPQILIKFSLFPTVSADKVVDLETRNLVAGVLANEDLQALKEVIHADPQQDVTLGELLKTWVANRSMTPETIGVLIDVLQSRGYLGGESTPEVLTRDGQQARMILGAETPRSAALGTEVQVTPHVASPASGFVRLEVEAQWREQVDPNDTSDRPDIRQTDMVTTIAIPFGKSVALVADKSDGRGGSLHMLLVSPTIFVAPQPGEGQTADANATTIVASSPQDNTPDSNAAQVLTNWMIVEARTDAVLDRETLRLICEVLAGERPQIARELAATRRKMTLGQVLKTYVARQSISPETGQALIDLLDARGLATVLSSPALISRDGQQAELRSVSEEWFSPRRLRIVQAGEEPNLIKFEYGTSIKNTAHVEQDGSITLDMSVTFKTPEPRTDPNALPVVHETGASTTVNVREDRYFSLLSESTDSARQTQGAESLLIMVKSSVVRPAPRPELTETHRLRLNHKKAQSAKELLPREYQQYVQAQDPGDCEPNDAGHILTITAPAAIAGAIQDAVRKLDAPPRQVLLDVRIVEAERADLLKSGVEWQFPTVSAERIHLGYSPDATFTNSLLATLNRLAATHQADILSNPQIVAMDGHTAQLRSTQEEWYLMSDPPAVPPGFQRSESGTILNITPRIGDSNAITLETAIEVFNTVPGHNGPDLPIVTRRQAKSAITITTGGTVAVAGLTSKQSDQTTKEIAVFITATLVPEGGPAASSLHSPKETASPATSVARVESADSPNRSPTPVRDANLPGLAAARQMHASLDPLAHAISMEIARAEQELVVLRQTREETNPNIARQKAFLEALQDKLQSRQTTLGQEFDRELEKQLPAISKNSGTSPGEISLQISEAVAIRDIRVNLDTLVQEWAKNIVAMEKELCDLRQSHLPSHPTLRQKQAALDDLYRRLKERRKTLWEESGTGGPTVRRMGPTDPLEMSATFTRDDLLNVLNRISRYFGVNIATDWAVRTQPITATLVDAPIEATLRQVLQETPYAFKLVSQDNRPTYLVYRTITANFEQVELLQALDEIAEMTETPIIPSPNVEGKVTAHLTNVDLETALRIMLAGTPFVFKKTGRCYIVGDGRSGELGPSEAAARIGTQIHVIAMFVRIPGDRPIDPDTAAEVFNLIAPGGSEKPAMSLDKLDGAGADKVLKALAGQIAGTRFQEVIGLLESKGLLVRVAEPHFCALAGERACLNARDLFLAVRHEVLEGGRTIRLNVEASMGTSTVAPPLKGSGTLEILNDRDGLLWLGTVRRNSSQTDRDEVETYLLIVHPVLLAPNAQQATPA
ncbi:MAG: M56 family metallopeptidase, partial [Phycisphaerales bacterium]